MENLFFDTIILRTPAFSLQDYKKLLSTELEETIIILLKKDLFLNSLYLASKEVYELALQYPALDQEKKDKFEKTIIKYAIRSSTRCTPFGLFAATHSFKSSTNNNNDKILVNTNNRFAHIRLDMNYSLRLANTLINHPEIKYRLKYFPNDTLYKLDNKYRYLEYTFYNSNLKKYTLSSIDLNSTINYILKIAANGITFFELVRSISEKVDVEYEECEEFAKEILSSQLLLSELEISSIGKEPEYQILSVLESLKKQNSNTENENQISIFELHLNSIIFELRKCQLSVFNRDFVNNSLSLKEIYSNITDFNGKSTLQCDLYNNDVTGGLSTNQLKLIKKALSILKRFNHQNRKQESRISKFRNEFINRYDQKVMPICEVLDPDFGIRYGSDSDHPPMDGNPLIDGIQFSATALERTFNFDELDYFLISKIQKNSGTVLNIDQKEIEQFANQEKFLNILPTESIMCSLIKNKDNRKDFIFVNSITEGSANKLLGRFTSGNKEIDNLTKDIIRFEESHESNSLFAEIDHLPETHLGNIVFRNSTYDHTIGFLAGNGISDIKLSDVFISVRNNKIILWSKTLKKEIIPMYSNVLNTSLDTHLPIFKLLLDISSQYREINNPVDWNKYHQFYQHIPRVQIDNIILKKESWIVTAEDFNNIPIDEVKIRLAEKNVNKTFVISQGDNEIVIDTDNYMMLQIFIEQLKKSQNLILTEFIYEEYDSVIYDENNNQYSNEFIISIKKDVVDLSKYRKNEYVLKKSNKLFIDDGWVFFKLYTSENVANKILISLLPILQRLEKAKKIQLFFFIKYYDPSFHIRLRIKAAPKDILEISYKMIEGFRKIPYIRDISINEYDQELERYGYDQIPLFENIFHLDSILAIKAYSVFDDDIWKFALFMSNLYCDLFDLSIESKIQLLESVKSSFERELKAAPITAKFINQKYSDNKEAIEQLISNAHPFLIKNKKLINDIKNEIAKIKYSSQGELYFFLQSIIHMSIIRIVKSYNRINEFVIIAVLIKGIKANFHKNRIR